MPQNPEKSYEPKKREEIKINVQTDSLSKAIRKVLDKHKKYYYVTGKIVLLKPRTYEITIKKRKRYNKL